MTDSWNIRFWEYDFLAPHWLWLLLLVPAVFFWMLHNEGRRGGELKFSRSETLQHTLGASWVYYLRLGLITLLNLAFALLILAIARPYNPVSYEDTSNDYKNGIDIIIAMDVSGSMLAMDFEPNRLEASKKVAKEFIDGRKGDRIGLVVYAGEAYTACPATLDYKVLKEQVDKISDQYIEGGTAIGTGLGTAVTRLRSDTLKSKVIILLTDGSNNAGDISPETAAELAKAKNIRVYTIGVGSNGSAPSPVPSPFGVIYQNLPVEIDEQTLIRIAQKTGGEYFRATDEEGLRKIYGEIEKLEKRKMLNNQYKTEPPPQPEAFMRWGIIFIFISWLTYYFLFRSNE